MESNNLKNNNQPLGFYTTKEIFEIPDVLEKIYDNKQRMNKIAAKIVERQSGHIYLIGAGSSYHAGFAISYMFNRITNIPTFAEYSMEFQYLRKPILSKDDCIIGLSQSGETKDTIETITMAKSFGCFTIGISNSLNSRLAKTCDEAISLECGEEKSVLATKTYVAELAVLALLSLEIANIKKILAQEDHDRLLNELMQLPQKIRKILPRLHHLIKKRSNLFKFAEFCFILGGGPDYPTAMEASLKLKEGARILGQAYATAEFPHGPITLADTKAWILAFIPHENNQRKHNLINLLKRIKDRKATILAIFESTKINDVPDPIDYGIRIPNTLPDLQPLLMILPIQLLTLEIAKIKGLNPDAPQFLSKVSGI